MRAQQPVPPPPGANEWNLLVGYPLIRCEYCNSEDFWVVMATAKAKARLSGNHLDVQMGMVPDRPFPWGICSGCGRPMRLEDIHRILSERYKQGPKIITEEKDQGGQDGGP